MNESATTSIEKLSLARQLLAEASTIDEIKQVIGFAEQARLYAKQKRLGLETQNLAAELHLSGVRLLGAALTQLERNESHGGGPGRGNKTASDDGHGFIPSEYRAVLDDTQTTRQDANRWQRIAAMPEPAFVEYIIETKAASKELTTTGALQAAARLIAPEPAFTPAIPSGRYRCIVIDPPWPIVKIERAERPNQGDTLDYPTMSLEAITALPIADLAEPDGCHMYLWTTHKFLPDALAMFAAWGARYQCLMTWVKPTGMTPYSWMYNTEHVLFGRIGNLDLERMGLKLAFDAPVIRHSQKPDVFYERVIAASPGPRLEMFARQNRPGFDVWGNEVSNE